jgi:hypothetical protein
MAARVLLSDPRTELTILSIEHGRQLPIVEWGDSDKQALAEDVLLIHLLSYGDLSVVRGLVSGRVAALGEKELLQIAVAISSPIGTAFVFDMQGRLVGFRSRALGNGAVFALPSKRLREVVSRLPTGTKPASPASH